MRPKSPEKEAAIRAKALAIIADEGLENLSMQKLAKAANVSPRTIYIKYADKEDFLVKLFIDEVMGAYEKASLEGFSPDMSFSDGVKKLWLNAFRYLTKNKPHFSLLQYGKSSPLLNKAFQERGIREGQYFGPIHRFLQLQVKAGIIPAMPLEVHRALLFSPALDLVNEYFDHQQRPKQIITEKIMLQCCEAVIKGLVITKNKKS